MSERESGYEGWAILELMGHRRLGGRVSEVTIAGAPFVRIDIPHPQEAGVVRATQFYSPAAIYAITPTTEEIASAIASGAPEPVTRWDLRALDAPPCITGPSPAGWPPDDSFDPQDELAG